ncbi:MAG: rane protein [Phycisphaerales bacterium]|nr:rane protein [Phycisphaerales bacterium]
MSRRNPDIARDAPGVLDYAAASAQSGDRRVHMLIGLAVLGILARFAIAACSWGTSDTLSFNRFAWSIEGKGILETYRADSEFNHPPIPGYWAWLALQPTRAHPYAFAFLFRVPIIMMDAASIWLLWRIWRRRDGPRRAAVVAALYAWCPVAILVSGYHGNTDAVYAFFCLLCVYLIEDLKRPLLGGLALAAAINIKLIPVLLILPLALTFRRWGDVLRFATGLALGALPFVPVLLLAGPSFSHNALAYKSRVDLWGVNFFILQVTGTVTDGAPLPAAVLFYRDLGRYLLLGLVAAWSVAARLGRRWDRYEIAGITLALFLILAPGFGVQYTIIVLPLMFATRVRLATIYGLCAGAFLFAAYMIFWDGGFPLSSLFNQMFPPVVGAVGLPAWGMLILFVVLTVVRGMRRRNTLPACV